MDTVYLPSAVLFMLVCVSNKCLTTEAQFVPTLESDNFLRGAIKCYSCNNERPGCDDPFDNRFRDQKHNLYLVQCSSDQECIKVITKDEEGQRIVIRDCVTTQAYDMCNAMNGTYQDFEFCETCNRDACNNDSRAEPKLLLLLALAKLLLANV